MSSRQRQISDSGERATDGPEWARAWADSIDALDDEQSFVPHELRVSVDNVASGGCVPDEVIDADAPIVEMGTGTHLHAPDLAGGTNERACSRGHQNGVEGSVTEHEVLSAWRDECSDVVCQSYFDGLRERGVIGGDENGGERNE